VEAVDAPPNRIGFAPRHQPRPRARIEPPRRNDRRCRPIRGLDAAGQPRAKRAVLPAWR